MSSISPRRQVLSLLASRCSRNPRPSSFRTSCILQRSASSLTIEPNTGNAGDGRRRKTKSARETSIYADEWVPAAYRGAQKTNEFQRHPGSSSSSTSSRRRSSPRRMRKPNFSREQYGLQREVSKRQDRHDQLLEHWENSVRRLARKYQASLGRPPLSKTPASKIGRQKSKLAAEIIQLTLQLQELLGSSSHPSETESNNTVDLQALVATEDLYRGICRALQQAVDSAVQLAAASTTLGDKSSIVTAADVRDYTHLQPFADEAALYVELAEQSLLVLAKFQSERARLVDTASITLEPRSSETMNNETDQGGGTSAKGGLFQSFVTFLLGDNDSANDDASLSSSNPILARPMAHEDFSLSVTTGQLSSVLRAMYGLVVDKPPNNEGPAFSSLPLESQQQLQDQAKYQEMAQRMVALLDVMPPSWKLTDAETLELVLDLRCRVGSVESARACLATYQRYSHTKNQIRFALVLRAYLGAALYETDEKSRLLAAKEATSVLHEHWNANGLPKHFVERVLHASIILNGITVADRIHTSGSTDARLWELADGVVKRTLGRKMYDKLLKELESSESPSLDYLSIPLVNYMTQLYANSGDADRLAIAQKTLGTIISNDRVGVGRMIVFPVVETANAVLRAITRQYENKAKAKWEGLMPEQDLAFAVTLVDDMLDRRENMSWPDSDTFETMFRLLLALKPVDIGEQAERLLARMELRNILSPTKPLSISLSTYHRVLCCWLEAAKIGTGHEACERAWAILEKLEAQSSPLLLSDTESRMPVALPLYNILLRPTRQTYKLVLQICLEMRNDDAFETALRVANETYARMEQNKIVPDKESAKRLAVCRNRVLRMDHAAKTAAKLPMNMISSETMDMLSNPQAAL